MNWHHISKQPPKDTWEVLVTILSRDGKRRVEYARYRPGGEDGVEYADPSFSEESGWYDVCNDGDQITHWANMPEPKKLSILHIALGGPEFDRAASDRGHDVYRMDWRRMPDVNREIIRCIKGQSFDLVFAQIQTAKVIYHETWDALRASGAFVIHWSGDVRDDIGWFLDAAPHVDITAFTNMDDVNAIREAGHRAEYLQIGYDEKIYTYAEKERSGVVFLGNDYGDRFPLSEARAEMVERMKAEFGDQFKAYGKRQDNKATTPAQEVAIYQSALVAINYDHFNRPLFASDRILRAQACGAAVVSMAYEGINDEHPYVGAAESLDDMVKMVRFALDNPERAAALGKMGADHTLSMHRWNNRFETIEQWTS